MSLIIANIKGIVQYRKEKPGKLKGGDLDYLPVFENSYLKIENGKISEIGSMESFSSVDESTRIMDAKGGYLFPSYVDSHTHLVFAETREKEFVMRIKGKSYEEIAAEGGGILNSAKKLQHTSEESLFNDAKKRLFEVIRLGTGAIEIKSGYGLSLESEIKMLSVIKQLKKVSPIPIKSTFLGAHAIPQEYKSDRRKYMDLLINEMVPKVSEEGLADYIDVFCDRGFFTPEETEEILEAGSKYNLKPKVHANELGRTGGIQAGVKYSAVSVDHLEHTGEEEIAALKSSETIPTLLPGTAFFLNLEYPPARKMIDAGLPVSLASDYNPGSCPTGNMNFITSLGCIKLRMTPAEALNAATVNAAYALEMEDSHGYIMEGLPANFFITKPVSSPDVLQYQFSSYLIDKIFISGNEIQ